MIQIKFVNNVLKVKQNNILKLLMKMVKQFVNYHKLKIVNHKLYLICVKHVILDII